MYTIIRCVQQSEDPKYRIAALEGELRLCQDKLTEAHSNYEQRQKNDQKINKENLEKVKKEKEEELEMASQKLTKLDMKVNELQILLRKSVKSTPQVTIDNPTPPLSSSSNRKSKAKKDHESAGATKDPESNRNIKTDHRPRSASYTDLTSIEKVAETNKKSKAKKLSPEMQRLQAAVGTPNSQRRSSIEKRSIAELVAESMNNPSSMASIRQELKSDSFTPKIQRKFHMKNSNPTTLPSMTPTATGNGNAADSTSPSSVNVGSHLDTSPRLKEINVGSRSSPVNSPSSRRRWTSRMKDSAI